MSSTSSNNTTVNGGIGFAGALTIAFIVLKLLHQIDWPWGWVLAPIWIPAAIAALIAIVIGAVLGVLKWRERRRAR